MNPQVQDQILSSPRLPSLPTIALEVIELAQRPDVNIKQIAQAISHDPALTSKILKTVNSSFYGQAQTISTVTHALVVLGLNAVRTLALGFSLVAKLKDSSHGDFDHLAFWKRSLFSAAAARTLARRVGLAQQEEVFLAGLLSHLGVLTAAQALGPPYCQLVNEAGSDYRQLVRLERERLQTDHAEIGAVLLEHWRLPPVLTVPVRHRLQPDGGPAEMMPLIRCVSLGGRAAEVFMSAHPAGVLDQYYQLALSWFGLAREVSEPLLTEIHDATVEMRRLLDLPTGPLGDAQEILARANEALLQISLQSHYHTSALEQTNRQLAQQATHDSLTGAANRGLFTQRLNEWFPNVQRGGALSLVFLDVDRFKAVNDTHGHQIGDGVLIEIVALLKKALPEQALVARYGGEEFAVLLPDTDRVTAARLAEAARALIEATPIELEPGRPLRVTVSLGVASSAPGVFERAEQLVRAADLGVYAAKSAGRNCVRVFSPKPRTRAA